MSKQQMTNAEKREWQQWLDLQESIRNGYEPIANETEKEKRKRIEHLLKPENFNEFIKYYFEKPENPFAPLGWFHKLAVQKVLVDHEPLNAWEWHRESAKSVIATIFFPVHLLVAGGEDGGGFLTGMILGSQNQEKAGFLYRPLEAHLRNNKRLINDFGDFGISGSWKQGYFRTKKGVGFWGFGLGQDPAGVRDEFNRPNYGVIDDADNKDTAKNQTITKEILDWVTGEFMGCLRIKGNIFVMCNNRVHKAGLTAHFVGDVKPDDPKREGLCHIKVYFTEDPKTHAMLLLDEGGVPAWKENFTLEDCQRKRKAMGYRNFMRQMYHWHIEEGNLFTDEMLPWTKALALHEYDELISYCDPAFGDSGKACYRAVVLVGRTKNDFHILWVWLRQKGSYAQAQKDLAQRIKDGSPIFQTENAKFRMKVNCKHYIESGELQKKHILQAYKEINEETDFFFMPKLDMEKKADKDGRIESLEPIAEHGHLLFNEALKQDNDMITLRDQFKGFPDGFVDGPDAVEGAIEKLNSKRPKTKNRGAVKSQHTGKYKRNSQRMG
jgi:hypothetical protein